MGACLGVLGGRTGQVCGAAGRPGVEPAPATLPCQGLCTLPSCSLAFQLWWVSSYLVLLSPLSAVSVCWYFPRLLPASGPQAAQRLK